MASALGQGLPDIIDETGFLVASWAMTVTWGIMLMQASTYLQNRKRDPALLQATVLVLFLVETASTILLLTAVQPKTTIVTTFLYHTTLCSVNLFVIWRYQLFTRRWWLSGPLVLLTVASFAAYLHTNITAVGLVDLVVSPGVPNVVKVIELLNEVGLSTKVAATVECVAVSATYILLLIQLSSHFMEGEMIRGKKILKNLILMTLESGTVTIGLSAANLVNAWRSPDAVALHAVIASAARAYYMTMLFNLNMRNSGGAVMNDPSLSHITSQLRTRPNMRLDQTGSSGVYPNATVVHVIQDTATDGEKKNQHEKKVRASNANRETAVV